MGAYPLSLSDFTIVYHNFKELVCKCRNLRVFLGTKLFFVFIHVADFFHSFFIKFQGFFKNCQFLDWKVNNLSTLCPLDILSKLTYFLEAR